MFDPADTRVARLEAWYRAEYPALLRFAMSVTTDRSLAEELVQETFVRVGLAGDRIATSVQAYARATLVNLARTKARRKRHAEVPLDEAHGLAAAPQREHDDEVWSALKSLSPRQRAVVHLRFFEDMAEREVASTLGMTTGSVKKHTDRAMKKLRAVLDGRQS